MTRRLRYPLAVAAAAVLASCGLQTPPPVAQFTQAPAAAPTPTSAAPSTTSSPPSGGFTATQLMTVRVRNVTCDHYEATGTGFGIDDHTLVTNHHVVANAATLQISTVDGRDLDVTGYETTDLADLALIHTKQALPAIARLAPEDALKGDTVTAVGYPLGEQQRATNGEIQGTYHDEDGFDALTLDAVVRPGNSGGPLLDTHSRVVGVIYARAAVANFSVAIPISILHQALDTNAFTAGTSCASSHPSPTGQNSTPAAASNGFDCSLPPADLPTLRADEPDNDAPAVTLLQTGLTELGDYRAKIDGQYGPVTQAAVIDFQTNQNLTPDGTVDTTTWEHIFKILC